jgi:hypothetical protein
MLSRAAIWLYVVLATYIVFNTERYKNNIFQWDCSGYYVYLPAAFIYHDLHRMDFYYRINSRYNLSGPYETYGLIEQKTGCRTNKYAVGSAVLMLPLFLVAHCFTLSTHLFDADGYSMPYQFAGIFSAIVYAALGLYFIRKFLSDYFPDLIVALTLICLALGSNLYCYTAFFPGMSHPFSFFLFSAVLFCTHKVYSGKYHLLPVLGLLLGLVAITRPANIVIAILPLFWQVNSFADLSGRYRLLYTQRKYVLISLLFFVLALTIQMGYWKVTHGSFVYYSYVGERFNFAHPHLLEGIFGFRKGWFVYTPVALLATGGLIVIWRGFRDLFPAFLVFLVLNLYVVFSWNCWWYGGGFGARPLIESMAVMAFPLACVTNYVFTDRCRHMVRCFAITILVLVIALNMFQTYQYYLGTLDCDRMNRAFYLRIFGKVRASEQDWKYRMTDEEYRRQDAESKR